MGRDFEGLSSSEAKSRLVKYGPNKLPEKPPPSSLKIFLAQLKSPLVYVLLVAGVVTFFLKEYADTAIISLAVFINTILGFVQEKKASQALQALKGMLHPEAEVVRDGKRIKIAAEHIVPGDIVVLPQGEKIPADGIILEASHMFVEEAILTGESAPVGKSKKDEAYMGTIVTAGRGFMKITKTGKKTKMGEIALSIQEIDQDTPLKKQLKQFSKHLSILVLVLVATVFLVGLLGGKELSEIFITSVALAVSAIPEGLLVALTVILAIGMQRILRKKGLVRNLVSAETLGGVTTICIDKTGTLTEGKMKTAKLVGDKKDLAKQAILTSDRDDPIVIAAYNWAVREENSKELEKFKRIDSLPFSSEDRFAATLHKWHGKDNMLFVNGAPDFLLEWCSLSKEEKEDLLQVIEQLTTEGMRLMGMARKSVGKTETITKDLATKNLEWVGILAFSDPVRKGVSTALKKAKTAGIKIVIITGDYAKTALSVTNALGLPIKKDEIILGEELDKMPQGGLSKALMAGEPMLFARTTPNQKLKIVKALKEIGEVVAMTGDGVNDAPALAASDIGIAVAEATDVSKESADLVLLDSSFETIVTAIEEGRGIFDNIRKVILYLLSDAFSEIVAVLGAILIATPLPITAVQILWINLVSDGFPNLALTIDPKRKDAMIEPPRSPKEFLVNKWMISLIAMVSIFSGASALVLFWFVYKSTGDVVLSRSVAFATLGINSLAYVFSIRALRKSVWKVNPVNNKLLIAGIMAGIALQIFPFVFPPARNFFGTTAIPMLYWVYIIGFTLLMLVLIELSKLVFKEALVKKQ